MAANINDFPMLTDTLKKMIAYNSSGYRLFYEDHVERKTLDSEPVSESSNSDTTVLSVVDSEGVWHPEKYNLIISGNIHLMPSLLFGQNGIAGQNDEIGIAVIWTAKDSSLRGTYQIGNLKKTGETRFFQYEIKFPKGMLRGTVTLKTVLYLKNKGLRKHDEFYFASAPGTILGTLDDTRLIIDGNGSVFPVVQIARPDRPLWWVECNWSDPAEDQFEEDNFCLYLNTTHSDYPALCENGKIVQTPLLNEIIASAVQILITEVMNNPEDAQTVKDGKDIVDGSVSAVVRYMINVFGWNLDITTPQKLASDIRCSLGRKLRK